MLSIVDTQGIDLVSVPPQAVSIAAQTAEGADYHIQLQVIEDSTALPLRYASGTLYWHDGQVPEVFPYNLTSQGTLTVDTHRVLATGDHIIQFVAHNYRAPQPDIVATNFSVTVLPRTQFAPARKNLIAPILPKDDGFPNAEQWNFNIGYDLEVLQSSVKMLLTTGLGERVMLPEYGTRLKKILFEPIVTGIQDVVQEEIATALNQWEPRVTLQSLSIERVSPRAVALTCVFLAKATQDSFTTRLNFSL